YAREHVADLETHWTMGDTNRIDREIETTGVEFQIATRLTSWVAVDLVRKIEKQGTSRHQNVPQNLPHGTRAESFGLRGSQPAFAEEDWDAAAPSEIFSDIESLATSSLVARRGEFEQEEVTGQVFGMSAAEKTPSAPASKAMQSYSPQQAAPPTGTPVVGGPQGGMPLGGAGRARLGLAREKAPAHVLSKSRRPLALWLSIVLVMIVIALLLWWLVL
nr:hypothetical protein [Deltaproteobacteria bacterium]